jgi:uncharacterized protein YbjT (DUF2867 family)
MTMKSTHNSPILVAGAAGDISAIGRNLTAMLLAKGHKVRALVRREDERAEGLHPPISAVDVARAVSVILDNPTSHIGHVYNLTGFESTDLDHYARVFSEALGRTIRDRDW